MFNYNGTAYATLAEAVAACAAGGLITVDASVYTTGYTATIDKPLTLRGLGATPDDTVFTAATATMLTVITNAATEANPIRIENLSFTNSPTVLALQIGKLLADTGTLTPNYDADVTKYVRITNCRFDRVSVGYSGMAISLRNVRDVVIDGCYFRDTGFTMGVGDYNTTQTYAGMILKDLTVKNCTFTGTNTPVNGGPYLYACMQLQACRPKTADACHFMQVSNIKFIDNVVTNAVVKCLYIETGTGIEIARNSFTNCGNFAITQSRYPNVLDVNIKWTKSADVLFCDNTITDCNVGRSELVVAERFIISAKNRVDGTTYGFLIDGKVYEASLCNIEITRNVITGVEYGIVIGNGTNLAPGTGSGSSSSNGYLPYGTTTEHGPFNMDITHNDIDASIIALRDNRYGGREPVHAQFNSYAGKHPSGGVRDAVDLNRVADGNGALIEGPSIQWFPHSAQYVKYRGKNSRSKDSVYAA